MVLWFEGATLSRSTNEGFKEIGKHLDLGPGKAQWPNALPVCTENLNPDVALFGHTEPPIGCI